MTTEDEERSSERVEGQKGVLQAAPILNRQHILLWILPVDTEGLASLIVPLGFPLLWVLFGSRRQLKRGAERAE